jgi:pimeloyl-ACP methyl ester carboxylesterase
VVAFPRSNLPMIPKRFATWLASSAAALLALAGCSSIERKLLFYPSHDPDTHELAPWYHGKELVGYARTVKAPGTVWLMLHGNGGQASGRAYALASFSDGDSVYFLEYPGYGDRPGVPSAASLNAAAREGYLLLRETYPGVPVCVASESLGAGPAATLAAMDRPPEKFVLVVPFERLSLVARDHYPSSVVSLLLSDDWDNIAALANYKGPVEIYGAADDTIIPVAHAKALAAAHPGARFTLMDGGHNDWAHGGRVRVRNP